MSEVGEIAVRKLGAYLCWGCVSAACYGCAKGRRVEAIVPGDVAESIPRARAWIEIMDRAEFRRDAKPLFSAVAKFPRPRRGEPEPRLPRCDHPKMWRKAHVGAIFTSQPYTDWMSPDIRDRWISEMQATCALYGLEMIASDEMSWWFPKKTTLVIVGKMPVLEAAGLISASARSS